MNKNLEIYQDSRPWFHLFAIISVSALFLLFFQALGYLCIYLFYDISLSDISYMLTSPELYPNSKTALYIIQFFTALGLFIVGPLFYLYVIENKKIGSITASFSISLPTIVMITLIVFSFMFFNSIIIKWNQEIVFPEFLRGFEQWAIEKEELLKERTAFFTSFKGFSDFMVAFLIIAILAPVGEELLFRGLLQNKIMIIVKNYHVAIWITAFLFSAFHFQFFGFFPRLLLGALFGYLYVWSANIWVPILSHFINNAFTLVLFYLNQKKIFDFDPDNTEQIPLSSALTALIITTTLIYLFYKRSKEKGAPIGDQ